MDFFNRNTRYFISIAEEGSFSLASKSLRIGKAALSLAITQLEEDLQIQLFQKVGRGLVLSPEGQRLLEVLRQADQSLALGKSLISKETLTTPIRFGVVTHWAQSTVIPILNEIESRFGTYQAHFGYSMHIFEQVRKGNLDFGIISWATRKPRWNNCITLIQDPHAIVGHKRKYAFIKEVKNVKELRQETWIWHRMPQNQFVDYLKPLEKGIVVDTYSILKQMLFSGVGIAWAQLEFFSKKEMSQLVQAPIKSESLNLYLVYNDNLERRHTDLMDYLTAKIIQR